MSDSGVRSGLLAGHFNGSHRLIQLLRPSTIFFWYIFANVLSEKYLILAPNPIWPSYEGDNYKYKITTFAMFS